MKPIFEGKVRKPHDTLFFRYNTNRALIQGDWKLVTHRASQWELYNIVKDGTEMNNLAAKHPDKVKELSALWHKLAKDQGRLKGKSAAQVSEKTPPLLKKSGVPANSAGNKGGKGRKRS